ncbi:hypothetical protein AQ917_03765 [Burkholderia pseudomallei]|nr:hypothetical protein AQ917_03765 [Burkholderia pseudomallei]ONC58381.1 hypothetical protein AQ918_00110 [Burkholderia pseudomallei]
MTISPTAPLCASRSRSSNIAIRAQQQQHRCADASMRAPARARRASAGAPGGAFRTPPRLARRDFDSFRL